MSAIADPLELEAVAIKNGKAPDSLFEVINGQYVELPPMSIREVGIANILTRFLWFFLGEDPAGHVAEEMLFRLAPNARRDRRPDVAYIPYARWPDRIFPATEAWDLVPSLAVEIISKSNTSWEILEKINDYFRYGVQLVWVIHPVQRNVYVYDSPKSVKILDEKDTLDGGAVLPGFQLPIRKLFENVPVDPDQTNS